MNHKEDISKVPEYILAYIAPMACGEKERAELIRRQKLGIATMGRSCAVFSQE